MTASNNNTIELNDNDVVCGRGGLANKHPGNRMLRRICSENKVVYQSFMNPSHKQCLVLSILMAIQQHGGKFVFRTKNGWEEISDKKAKEKTAQLLRESEAPAPITTTSKPMTMARTKPVVTVDASCSSSSNDCSFQTTQAIRHQPMLIPPEPLPMNSQFVNVTPEAVSSNGAFDFDLFMQSADPLPVPPAPVAPAAPMRAFDDGDLFDLIPVEAPIESNPEFQDMCYGLVSVLNTVAC